MTASLARTATAIARPLTVLVPLIRDELTAGEHAALEHYRRAGEMLLEARTQVAAHQWGRWLSKNFTLSRTTAWRYMTLAAGSDGHCSVHETTLSAAIGERHSDAARRVGAFRSIFTSPARVLTDENRRSRELALEVIEFGYKAAAMRLHPDRGGSGDAMRRLNRVRDALKAMTAGRTFE